MKTLTLILLLLTSTRALSDEFWVLKTVSPGVRVTYLKYKLHNFVYSPQKGRVYSTDAQATTAWKHLINANTFQIFTLQPPTYAPYRAGFPVAW